MKVNSAKLTKANHIMRPMEKAMGAGSSQPSPAKLQRTGPGGIKGLTPMAKPPAKKGKKLTTKKRS